MKQVFKGLGFIILGYLITSFINMGTVLFFFYERMLAPNYVLFPMEILIMVTTSFFIGYFVFHLFKIESIWPIYTVAILLIAVTGFNIYLDNSLEPLWYKVIYILTAPPALILGAIKNQKADT